MSGRDEQPFCGINICPKCNNNILTWYLKSGRRGGHFNVDIEGNISKLNNTIYFDAGVGLFDVTSIKCYHCGYTETDKNSILFKSIMKKASMAELRRN